MASDEDFLRIAVDEAFAGIRSGHGGPFGSVIAKDGEIVASGHNMVLKDNDPTAHGEVTAIRAACKKLGTYDLTGCTLYTSSEPCPMCKAAICWAKVSRVVYAASMDDANKILGFKDQRMSDSLRKGEDLTPSVQMRIEGYLGPFEEYRDKSGTIY